MLNLRSVVAQVHGKSRSIRNFCTSPPELKEPLSKKIVDNFSFGQSVLYGYAGWIFFEVYKIYKYFPTVKRLREEEKERLLHHHSVVLDLQRQYLRRP